MYTVAVFIYLIINSKPAFGFEPNCSPFHYEEKTLEKMIRQEVAMEKMRAEMEDVKHEVIEVLADMKHERNKIAVDYEKKANDIDAMKDGLDKAVANMKAQTEKETEHMKAATHLVAFRAHKATDKSINNNKVIIFTENLLSIGDAYNNQTGIFVAPVRGIYLFTAQICLNPTKWVYFGIFLEDRRISNTLNGDNDWQSCSSFDALTVVDQGEQVSVKCANSCDSTDNLWENVNYATNSFSGVLLHTIQK